MNEQGIYLSGRIPASSAVLWPTELPAEVCGCSRHCAVLPFTGLDISFYCSSLFTYSSLLHVCCSPDNMSTGLCLFHCACTEQCFTSSFHCYFFNSKGNPDTLWPCYWNLRGFLVEFFTWIQPMLPWGGCIFVWVKLAAVPQIKPSCLRTFFFCADIILLALGVLLAPLPLGIFSCRFLMDLAVQTTWV